MQSMNAKHYATRTMQQDRAKAEAARAMLAALLSTIDHLQPVYDYLTARNMESTTAEVMGDVLRETRAAIAAAKAAGIGE